MNTPLQLVLGKLPGHRKAGEQQFEARCPAHDDKRASLCVGVGQDERVLLKCQAGCSLNEILGAMELAPADLFSPKPTQRKQIAEYDYRDAAGAVLFQVVRFEPKDFRQRQPDGAGGWNWSIKGLAKVVYRLPELLEAAAAGAAVWVAEGEKDVEALRGKDLVATCNPGGAGKWLPEYSASFAGVSAVFVVPDNDGPGELHARAVATSLASAVPLVKVVRLPAGVKDAAAWLAAGGTRERLEQLAAQAPVFDPTRPSFEQLVADALADVEARAKTTEASPQSVPAFESAEALLDRQFPVTPWIVRDILVEEAVSAIAGEPKTAKTWSALELAVAAASGTKAFGRFETIRPRQVAVFLVEDDARSTRNRLRALAVGRGGDVRAAVSRIAVKTRGHLDLLDDKGLAWLIASCRCLERRPELLVLDPLRDLHSAKENDADAMAPVMGRLRLLRDLLHCAVVFVHHSAKAGEVTNARRPGQRMRGSGVVHASVDGGLYLSGLDTDGATRFESTADVELKSVRGAGQFALRLDLIDDEHGEAQSAKWTVTIADKTQPASANDATERAQASLLKFLKFEWMNAMGAARPLAIKMLQVKTRLRTELVGAALQQLATEGKAAQVFNKKKAIGWVYQPTESEKPTSQRVVSESTPVGPERTSGVRFPPSTEESTSGSVRITPISSDPTPTVEAPPT